MQRNAANLLIVTILFLALAPAVLAPPVRAQDNLPMCITGAQRECGLNNVGECKMGLRRCVNGEWGECDATFPVEEICNDKLDNDCNGLIDDCGSSTFSILLIGSGFALLLVALILSKVGK
jgi:hypothetical protein